MPTVCYLIEPAGRVRWGLRRYSPTKKPSSCPNAPGDWGYHQAYAQVGEEPEERDVRGYVTNSLRPLLPRSDRRWPRTCGCGYAFQDDDEWQRWTESLWTRVGGGEAFTLREATAGAMWDAWWMGRKGPDGRSLCVKVPGGHEWWIDGPGDEDPGWERTGEPPIITASPSVKVGDYHGWLTAGVLGDA